MNVLIVLAVAVIAILVYIGWSQHRSLRWPSDAECLEIMRQEGIDLSSPRMLEFWLNFPSREAALGAQPAAVAAGFEANVAGGGPGSAQPSLIVRKLLLPTKAELSAVRATLVEVARQHGGTYV